jgi:hypothetical protein
MAVCPKFSRAERMVRSSDFPRTVVCYPKNSPGDSTVKESVDEPHFDQIEKAERDEVVHTGKLPCENRR